MVITKPSDSKLPLRQFILAHNDFHNLLSHYRRAKDKPGYYKMWINNNPFNLTESDLRTLGIQAKGYTNKDLPPYFTFEQILNSLGYQIN